MKVYIFILKAQNKWGILPAIRLVLCVWICFKSANCTFYHRSRRGLQKPFFSVHSAYFMILKTERGLFDEFVPREISQVSSSLYFSTWLSISGSRIDSRDSRIDSQTFQESRCKWLSTYFWVVLYNGKNWAFPMFGLECSLILLKNCSS